ncbi:hypothetical protein ACGFYT_12900 [Streptomyces sp. NPDC048208]|uniref:hypothetical protein n=1 Tax=unclassified Streptomyces TaxID=2593676 RepID=UPI0033C625D8
MKRGVAAAATFAVAAVVNIATGVLTQHWAVAWWVAFAVLVVVGAGLQAWVAAGERPTAGQRVQDVIVGGSLQQDLGTQVGEQSVGGSEIGQDLTQRQGDAPHGP